MDYKKVKDHPGLVFKLADPRNGLEKVLRQLDIEYKINKGIIFFRLPEDRNFFEIPAPLFSYINLDNITVMIDFTSKEDIKNNSVLIRKIRNLDESEARPLFKLPSIMSLNYSTRAYYSMQEGMLVGTIFSTKDCQKIKIEELIIQQIGRGYQIKTTILFESMTKLREKECKIFIEELKGSVRSEL